MQFAAMQKGGYYALTDKSGQRKTYRCCQVRPTIKVVETTRRAKAFVFQSEKYTCVRPSRQCTMKKDASRGCYVYVFRVGKDTYKIGCSADVDRRLKQGRTWCSEIEKVATLPLRDASWRKQEQQLHHMLRQHRCSKGGTEIFKMKANTLADALARFAATR